MQRLDPHQTWHQIRGSLADAPVPIRLALASEDTIERRVALDRLAAFVAAGVAMLVDDTIDPPEVSLPLFPEIDDGQHLDLEATPMRHDVDTIEKHGCFARWLIAQRIREDGIGRLAKQAALDPGFPRDGDAKAVSARLNAIGADGDTHQLLEDAEYDWLAL